MCFNEKSVFFMGFNRTDLKPELKSVYIQNIQN